MEAAVLILAILYDGREPNGSDTQVFEITELFPDSLKGASLEDSMFSIERQMARRGYGVVESIHQQKVDPGIAPVGRRGEGFVDANSSSVDLDSHVLS
jgi:hypothetical protein